MAEHLFLTVGEKDLMLDNLFDVPPVGGINLYPSVGAALLPYKCPGVVEHLLLAVGEKDLMFDNLFDVPLVGGTNLSYPVLSYPVLSYPVLSYPVLFPYRRPAMAEHLFAVGNSLADVPSVAGTVPAVAGTNLVLVLVPAVAGINLKPLFGTVQFPQGTSQTGMADYLSVG